MSRAVVIWALSGRPWAFLNVVLFIPSFRAYEVISFANSFSVPDIFSATTVATSFADLTINAITASSTLMLVPASK